MKPLSLYQGQLASLNRQRHELDADIAQVLAEAVLDGYNIHDLLDPAPTNQERFDL